MCELEKEITPILEARNKVSFSTGQTIEFFGSRLIITDIDRSSTLIVTTRITDEYYDCEGNPRFWDVFWESDPSWSDGRKMSYTEILFLAKLVKAGSILVNYPIRQEFEGEELALQIQDPDEFNTF